MPSTASEQIPLTPAHQTLKDKEISNDNGGYDQVTASNLAPIKLNKTPKNSNRHSEAENALQISSATPPPLPAHFGLTPRIQSRHAGLTQREIPLSAALPPSANYERFIMGGGHIYATASEDYGIGALVDERFLFSSQSTNCESPIPRISEPTSPAMPQKFLNHHRRILFPLRKRFIQGRYFFNN